MTTLPCMTSTGAEQAQRTISAYLARLAAGDVSGVLDLFADDGVVSSPLTGDIPAREFYPHLAAEVQRSEITPVELFLSMDDPRRAAVRFRYEWTTPASAQTSFDCVDVVTITEDGKIAELRFVYDTHPLRAAWQASIDQSA